MSVNISGTDSMVGEYLICKLFCMVRLLGLFAMSVDRGFTQTFQCLEVEKNRDKTKRFEVSRIVEVNLLVIKRKLDI